MRVGVISDIHGNGVALDAVLTDAESHPVDQWVCLGDALQGGVEPARVVEQLRELECPVVLGNADSFLVTGEDIIEVTEAQRRVRDWTVEQLGSDGMDFVRSFVPTHTVDLGPAGSLLCFHGTPGSFGDVVLPESPAELFRSEFGGTTATLLCGGHTHQQWTTTIDGKTYFNPGSVGLAYNRHLPREGAFIEASAEYAILSTSDAAFAIEFLQVPLKIEALTETTLGSGHPDAERLVKWYGPR